jgi:hypothetical protein
MRRQVLSASLCLSSLICLPIAKAQQTPTFQSDPKFVSTVAEAKKLAAQRMYDFAIDHYKKANKISGKKLVAKAKAARERTGGQLRWHRLHGAGRNTLQLSFGAA